ncbi:MAG: DUF4188 domain-containing protein, partial [Sulfitobacter sp.]
GMRINRFWKVTKWVPAFMAMPRMLKELSTRPSEETGFLGYNILGFGSIVQYWRSFEHLEAYANSHDGEHFPAWVAFNKRMKNSRGDVGVWHESYAVKAGNYETLYMSMPPHGLGKAASLVAATGTLSSARKRFDAGT